jgi:hypothetical protein
MFASRKLSMLAAAALALLALSGCDTEKRIEVPQGDTPTDTGMASRHVRLLSEPEGRPMGIRALRATADGGYVAVGYLGQAPWILKTNAEGSIEWQETVPYTGGHFGLNRFNDVGIASDGGYVAVGRLLDRATAIKFRADGSVAWKWWATQGPKDDPNDYLQNSAEAMSVAVKTGGAGFVIAGGLGETPLSGSDRLAQGSWVVELDFDGLQGQYIDPTVIGYGPGPAVFRSSPISTFVDPFHTHYGGSIEAVTSWTGQLTDDYYDYFRSGFWFAGSTREGQLLAGREKTDIDPSSRPEIVWKRSFGPGSFHSMATTDRLLPDGTHEQRMFLAGETPDAMLACELDGQTGEVLWATRLSAEASPYITRWIINAIQPTADGGAVLAASTTRAPAVLKLDRTGSIEWQYEYLPAHTGDGPDRGEALSIQVRTDGGYRVAGHQNIDHDAYSSPALMYFQEDATVFDVAADGSIDVNEKSGWTRQATQVSAESVALEASEPVGSLESYYDFRRATDEEEVPSASATNVIVETASGPTGVLPSPAVGSNDTGKTFYWSNSPGASGFIVFRSSDGINFTRANATQKFGFDFYDVGYFKLVAFNGAGYSEFSPVVGPLGPGTPTTPR